MLFTRCPECETTFRVTDETLKKANGQVRCGRCASVFNAYAELHDPAAKTFEPEPAPPRSVEPSPSAPRAVEPQPAAPTARTAKRDEPASDAPDPTAQSIGASSVADVVAEAQVAADTEEAEAAATATNRTDLSAPDIERVLDSTGTAPILRTGYVWPFERPSGAEDRHERAWRIAAPCLAVALLFQVIHHFSADIARHPTFAWITGVYGAFGVELNPYWDVHQYQIIDWVATAEPNSRGLGSLKITARIQNRGPQRQPYPAVQLRLKDRWEAAVGSRMFKPEEYLPRDVPRERLMSPGETTRAEIEVVDPGPDAYGFELDVCIEVEASLVTCGTDEVFL